jgi:hypothetical protein
MADAVCEHMRRTLPGSGTLLVLTAIALAPSVRAAGPNAADHCIHQFLEQDDTQHSYRATRRLEAENGGRSGWLEAVTDFSPQTGFRYQITTEGGSAYIRRKVLSAVLDAERDAIAQGETARSSLDRTNYAFESSGLDADGLAKVQLTPLRKDRVLVAGTMFLHPIAGDLVRLQGRLAKSPSFWVKDVDIQRSYERIGGAIVPVSLESKAQLRLLGPATLRMTYVYTEIDGRPVATSHARLGLVALTAKRAPF